MNISEGLYAYLSAYAGLIALTSTRIYPSVMPQDPDLPAIVYQKISATRMHTMQDDPGLARARFQFTAWATTHAGAVAVIEQIRAALQNQRIQTWGGSVTGVSVIGPENEMDGYERLDSGVELFSVSADYLIWHREA